MCGPQRGTPMTEDIIKAMPEEEAKFWEEFFEEAKGLMEEMCSKDESRPFAPTDSLKEKHSRAINEFKGGHYCFVQ